MEILVEQLEEKLVATSQQEIGAKVGEIFG